jgi:hypothetical protein
MGKVNNKSESKIRIFANSQPKNAGPSVFSRFLYYFHPIIK